MPGAVQTHAVTRTMLAADFFSYVQGWLELSSSQGSHQAFADYAHIGQVGGRTVLTLCTF